MSKETIILVKRFLTTGSITIIAYLTFFIVDLKEILKTMNMEKLSPVLIFAALFAVFYLVFYFIDKLKRISLTMRYLNFKINHSGKNFLIDGKPGELVLLQKTFKPGEIEILTTDGYIETQITNL